MDMIAVIDSGEKTDVICCFVSQMNDIIQNAGESKSIVLLSHLIGLLPVDLLIASYRTISR